MTTTFPPSGIIFIFLHRQLHANSSEVRDRRSLVAFKTISGILIIILMLLLVVALSMGYKICTSDYRRYNLTTASRHRNIPLTASNIQQRRRDTGERNIFDQDVLSTNTEDTGFVPRRSNYPKQQQVSSF